MFRLQEVKIVDFANSVEPDEAAYDKQSHLDLH